MDDGQAWYSGYCSGGGHSWTCLKDELANIPQSHIDATFAT